MSHNGNILYELQFSVTLFPDTFQSRDYLPEHCPYVRFHLSILSQSIKHTYGISCPYCDGARFLIFQRCQNISYKISSIPLYVPIFDYCIQSRDGLCQFFDVLSLLLFFFSRAHTRISKMFPIICFSA